MVEMLIAYLALELASVFYALVASVGVMGVISMTMEPDRSKSFVIALVILMNLAGVVGLMAGLSFTPQALAIGLLLCSYLGIFIFMKDWQAEPKDLTPDPEEPK